MQSVDRVFFNFQMIFCRKELQLMMKMINQILTRKSLY